MEIFRDFIPKEGSFRDQIRPQCLYKGQSLKQGAPQLSVGIKKMVFLTVDSGNCVCVFDLDFSHCSSLLWFLFYM